MPDSPSAVTRISPSGEQATALIRGSSGSQTRTYPPIVIARTWFSSLQDGVATVGHRQPNRLRVDLNCV